MEDRGDNQQCPRCGWNVTSGAASLVDLAPGATLKAGQYIVGCALSRDGFNITYIGWDTTAEAKCAIKEYLPVGVSGGREEPSRNLPVNSHERFSLAHGIELFREEARTLARLGQEERRAVGLVKLYEFFEENGTAHLVMECLEGMTLQEYLDTCGGKIEWQLAMRVMEPVFAILEAVHQGRIVYLGVDPGNIFLTRNNEIKLIGFGAANEFAPKASSFLDLVFRSGYSSPEQYGLRGKLGPWADLYALGATLYRMITGRLPPDTIDRVAGARLPAPRRLGAAISRRVQKAIVKALALEEHKRFQTVAEFRAAVEGRQTFMLAKRGSPSLPSAP